MSALLLAQTGHSLPLPPDPVVVGSDPSAQVPVRADLGIAARHYQIQPDPAQNGHWVVSLLPEHPVLVNGQPVPHALLRDGDVIIIDAVNNRIDVKISESEIATRKAAWVQPKPRYTRGVLAKYAKLVATASEGAVTDKYL